MGRDDVECFAPNTLYDLAARSARGLYDVVPREKREQGMPGARCTRGLVCKIVRRNAHEHTGSAETLRHSPRNGFTAYAVLLCPQNLPECANGRLSANRPLLD